MKKIIFLIFIFFTPVLNVQAEEIKRITVGKKDAKITIIAFESILNGLSKLVVNTTKIEDDLNSNWAVVAEAIQTILRREGFPKPYEALKELTRTNHKITKDSIQEFIQSLDISVEVKAELLQISPQNYTGI